MKLKYTIYPILFCFLINLYSCNFIEIDTPKDRIITATLFENETTATASVLGLYNWLSSVAPPFSNGATTMFTGLASDELEYTATIANQQEFFENNIATGNFIVYNNFWRQNYEIIYQATVCIEGLEQSSLPINVKNQLLGECYFIRAFCYWYLVNIFGGVPLATTTDYETNARLSRSTVGAVKEYILSDLIQASDLLVTTYPSNGKLRINYYTALALLTRYYLYAENWQEVENLSTQIIESGLYDYETDINQVFLAIGTESIWQIEGQTVFNTIEGNRFIPAAAPTVRPNYALSNSLIDAFESGDLRLSNWTGTKVVQDIVYTYPYKYKVSINAVKTEHYVMFRLAEVYLNRAEARAHLGKEQEALEDINILRIRANLAQHNLANTSNVLAAVLQERRIEFFAEWGHRWFDLKRTNTIDEILSVVKPNWESTDALFPIPSDEIIANGNLEQNPGYND